MKRHLEFLVIGAQKGGTTSLFEYLRHHPEIFIPPGKEAAYFSHDAAVASGWERFIRGEFSTADPGLKWGTVTPSYMVGGVYDGQSAGDTYNEWTVPLRIRERLPDVKLIALLRDPTERAYSHYKMMRMNGRERRSFDEAIDDLLDPRSLARSRACPTETTGYVTWGEYGRILAAYFDVFPREQFLVTFTNELEVAPAEILMRVQAFLGVVSVIPDNLGERYREGGTVRRFSRLNPDVVVRGVARNAVMRSLWHALPERTRRAMSHGYADAAYRVELWNRDVATTSDQPSAATWTRLREHFERDSQRLAALIGECPPWLLSAGGA